MTSVERVLFCTERYCDSNPACGPTNSDHLLVGSLMSTGMVGQVKRFYFDEVAKAVGKQRMEDMLLEAQMVFKPDLVVMTPLGGPLGHGYNPSWHVMTLLERYCRVFMIRFDAKPNTRQELLEQRLSHVGLLGSLKGYRACREIDGAPIGGVQMFLGTVDPGTYHRTITDRDIDVSFIGSVDPTDQRWPMRREYTDYLRANGVNVVVAGGQRGQRLEVDEMNRLFNRSKITLNFSQDASGLTNLKSRVFEATACGAMLMEDHGTETAELFRDGEEFVTFRGKEDLLIRVLYYLKHDMERKQIAQMGYEKTANVYSALNQWAYALEKMGCPAPLGGFFWEEFKDIMEAL